jgi:hypothetical protein
MSCTPSDKGNEYVDMGSGTWGSMDKTGGNDRGNLILA